VRLRVPAAPREALARFEFGLWVSGCRGEGVYIYIYIYIYIWRLPEPATCWAAESMVEITTFTRLTCREREFCIDNLVVRIYFIIVMNRRTGLAPWELTSCLTVGYDPFIKSQLAINFRVLCGANLVT